VVLDGLHDCRNQVRSSREACEQHLSTIADRLDHLEVAERKYFGAVPQNLEGRLRRVRDEVDATAAQQEALERKLDDRHECLQALFEAWAGGARDELAALARSFARQARNEARSLLMLATPEEPLGVGGGGPRSAWEGAGSVAHSEPVSAPASARGRGGGMEDVSANLDLFLALPAPTAARVFVDRTR